MAAIHQGDGSGWSASRHNLLFFSSQRSLLVEKENKRKRSTQRSLPIFDTTSSNNWSLSASVYTCTLICLKALRGLLSATVSSWIHFVESLTASLKKDCLCWAWLILWLKSYAWVLNYITNIYIFLLENRTCLWSVNRIWTFRLVETHQLPHGFTVRAR